MLRPIRALAVAGTLALSLFAGRAATSQTIAFSQYGATCDFFFAPAVLSGVFDPATGSITLDVTAATTCCNTFLAGQFLLFGQQIDPGIPLPIPGVVPGCLLSVQPFFVLALPPGQNELQFTVPPLSPGQQFFVQGLNDYFTTIGFSHDLQFSNGLTITTL